MSDDTATVERCTDCGEPCIDAGPGLGWQCVSDACKAKSLKWAQEAVAAEVYDISEARKTIEQQARTIAELRTADDVHWKMKRRLLTEIAEQAARLERADETFHKISDWARAYPLDVFPEPDFKRVHEVLSVAGLSLDQVSASNMRHVITQVQGMVDAAIDGAKT